MHYFYSDNWEAKTCFFDVLESKHILKSMRKKSGEVIHVLDGSGGLYRCRIALDDAGLAKGSVIDEQQFEPPAHQLHLAIAPTKNQSRIETMLEKATEMGLSRLLPMRCRHSERVHLKMDRLYKIAISAMKQSGNPFLPQIENPMDFSDLIEMHRNWKGDKAIAYLSDEDDLTPFDQRLLQHPQTLLLIGPEGDFSKQEIDLALQSGFTGVTLGSLRLRTETAGIFAAATIHALNL